MGDSQGNILIPRVSDWRLAITASRQVIATVEERVAGPLQDQPEWRLIPAIHLTALVHCPGGAAPTGYPGYYPQDEAHLALYLESTRRPRGFDILEGSGYEARDIPDKVAEKIMSQDIFICLVTPGDTLWILSETA